MNFVVAIECTKTVTLGTHAPITNATDIKITMMIVIITPKLYLLIAIRNDVAIIFMNLI